MLQDLDPYYFYSGRDVEDQLYGIYSQIRVQDRACPFAGSSMAIYCI